jgi:phage-related protein
MSTPVSELQKINPSSIVELFQLELNTAIHGSNTKYYFHNGTNNNENSNVIFDNIEYTKMPIEADGFEFNGKQLPRPRLTISNILGTFTTILLTLPQGLEGAKVTRIRTLERYIDNTNFTGGQILLENGSNLLLEDGNAIDMESGLNPFGKPDPTATFPNEIYYIDRKVTENRDIIQFELTASFDLDGVRLPKRQVLPADFPGVGTFFS